MSWDIYFIRRICNGDDDDDDDDDDDILYTNMYNFDIRGNIVLYLHIRGTNMYEFAY